MVNLRLAQCLSVFGSARDMAGRMLEDLVEQSAGPSPLGVLQQVMLYKAYAQHCLRRMDLDGGRVWGNKALVLARRAGLVHETRVIAQELFATFNRSDVAVTEE